MISVDGNLLIMDYLDILNFGYRLDVWFSWYCVAFITVKLHLPQDGPLGESVQVFLESK